MNGKHGATPSGVVLDAETCIGCGRCVFSCPTNVFRVGSDGKAKVAYPGDCHVCMLCVTDCPVGAISVDPQVPNFRTIYDQITS